MPSTAENDLRKKIIEENRRVHALENRLYLNRHPEQTNCYQTRLLKETLDTLDRHLNHRQARILELGSGTGYLHLPLLDRGHHVTGVDLSPEMTGVLRERTPSERKPRSRLVVMDVEEFAEKDDNQYDVVALSALLHHLYDYQAVVGKLCDRIEPGGLLLIFFEPLKQEVGASLRYSMHKGLSKLDEFFYLREMQIRRIPLFEEDYQLSDYQRQFGGIDPHCIAEVMASAHMQVLEIKKYCARRYGLNAWIANRILGTPNTFNLLALKASGK